MQSRSVEQCERDACIAKLAVAVVYSVRPNKGDRESVADCLQEAYLAGMEALNSADHNGSRPSRAMLFLAMRQAVYRLLRKQTILMTDHSESTLNRELDSIEARDFVATHRHCLNAKEQRAVEQYYRGVPARKIAADEGITVKGVYYRLREALYKLRVAAGILPAEMGAVCATA